MSNLTIFDEYQAYTEKYQIEYGKNTLVLMEVGSFYEMYATDCSFIDLHCVGNLLNIQVTRKNKSIVEVSRSNYMLAGFPSYCLEKFTNILLDNQYTIVVVSQTTPPPKPHRAVTNILSPGMRLEPNQPNENSFLMCIYLDNGGGVGLGHGSDSDTLLIGVSYIDISTGEVFVYENGCCPDQAIEEIQRVLTSTSPKEVLIAGANISNTLFTIVEKRLNLDKIRKKCTFHIKIDREDVINNTNFQNQLLRTAYPNHGLFNVVEYLGLERNPIALHSFCHLLTFAHRHREDVLLNIRKPIIQHRDDKLILSHNAYRHLDILPKRDGNAGLIHILNRCKTAIGKRGFRRRLLNPCTNPAVLNNMYAIVEHMINTDTWHSIRKSLSEVCDLERAFRRIAMGTLSWQYIPSIHDSLLEIGKISNTAISVAKESDSFAQLAIQVDPALTQIFDAYAHTLDMNKLSKANVENPFLRGVDVAIDAIDMELETKIEFVKLVGKELNGEATNGEPVFKLERNEKDGLYFSITAKRFKTFLKTNGNRVLTQSKIDVNKLTAKSVSTSSSVVKITHEALRKASNDIIILEESLKKHVQERYRIFLQQFTSTCAGAFGSIVEFVEAADFYSTNAANAVKFSYTKPVIIDGGGNESFMDIRELRHPIIERVHDGVPYVPNDVGLGDFDNGGTTGLLLFGVNASGKSSLMKSVGLALIMACCGMYVPCASMRFFPFTRIFTRIPSGDDLFAGHSTFTQEISELRHILNQADNRSLVIGDELCSGTEPTSAIAIVAAGILRLLDRGTSFIFASHLHEIVNLQQIKCLTTSQLNVCHLGVRYDGSKLIYDRVLKSGTGDTLYGIEVCRALDMEPEFMKIAQSIRHQILNIEPNIVTSKRTRYNAKLFKDAKCQICKQNKAVEVHHIVEQNTSDKNGIVLGRFHKNTKHNLVSLCETCHQSIHNGGIRVHGYGQTSVGVELMFEKTD
jgi:DNA mismatch repair protein MutS